MKKGDKRRRADLVAEIIDQMGIIDITLAPIKQLQKLSNSTIATSQPEQNNRLSSLPLTFNHQILKHYFIINTSKNAFQTSIPYIMTIPVSLNRK